MQTSKIFLTTAFLSGSWMLDNTGINTSPQSISCHWLAWMRMPWMPTWMSYWTCVLGSSAAKLSMCQTPAAPKSRTWRNCSIFVQENSCLRVCPEFSFQLCWLLDLEVFSWCNFRSGHWCHMWNFVFVGSMCSVVSSMFSDTLRAEISCHRIAFCSRFSNMGFFGVFQGRKRQWHRRSNGRGSGALFRLLSHRQVSIALLKFTEVYSGNCLISLLKALSCLTSICCQQKCALFWRGRGGYCKLLNNYSLIGSINCFPQLLWREILCLSLIVQETVKNFH